jgi:type I restriction enzyme, S subunit
LREDWIESTIEESCNVEYGTRIVRKHDAGTVYPVYGGGGETFRADTANRESRVVIARFAMSERCTRFVEGKFNLNDSGLTLSPRNPTALLPEFLDMMTLGLNDTIYGIASGSAQRNLKVPLFRKLTIRYPRSLSEQQRIVAILDEAFAGIASAVESAEENLVNSDEIFESQLNAIFANRGNGWVQKKLSDIARISHGFSFKGPTFGKSNDETKPIVLTPGNYTEKATLVFNENNTKRLSTPAPADYLFDVGELTVVMTDLSPKMKILGKPAFIERADVLHNQRIGRFIFSDDSISPRLIYYALRTAPVSSEIRSTATGTMVRHTAPKRILSNVVSVPANLDEQEQVVSDLDNLTIESQHLSNLYRQKLIALAELKQSILQKAFSGKLTAEPDKSLAEAGL